MSSGVTFTLLLFYSTTQNITQTTQWLGIKDSHDQRRGLPTNTLEDTYTT